MCGRAYQTYTDEELLVRYLNKKQPKFPKLKPNYNLSPTQDSPVLISKDGEKSLELFRWGLIPFWAKDIKIGYKMINARSETISEKPAFRAAFKKRRCIVPLTGFIEWKRDGESKRPFCIHLKDDPIMSVAGIWEEWAPQGEDPVYSFSVITTEANPFMSKIHDRMPVILDKESEEIWLDENASAASLQKLFKPCADRLLSAYEISTLINSPKNNHKDVLSPLASK